ncbi:MAG: hypothetical protein ABIP67_07220 [Burkholderiales bacterium]
MRIDLRIDEPIEKEGQVVWTSVIEMPQGEREPLWFRLPVGQPGFTITNHDPFVLATLFYAMRKGLPMHVHGCVSPSLLRNLEEFQWVWATCKPDLYHKVEITADREEEAATAVGPERTICAFSGGLDSAFAIYRHKTEQAVRLNRNITAGLMIDGFDIPLAQPETFERAFANSTAMLSSLDVQAMRVATNFKTIYPGSIWRHVFGIGVAACASLFKGEFQVGIKGSEHPYSNMVIPLGSSPLTDWMFSSQSFTFVHDGAAFTRNQKAAMVTQWPEAMRRLRVCWEGKQLDRNCGQCEKCLRTILNFKVNGVEKPLCLPFDVTSSQILNLHGMHEGLILEFEEILDAAKRINVKAKWVGALELTLKWNRRQLGRDRALPERIRAKIYRKLADKWPVL